MGDLGELIARVEGATGPDQHLNTDLAFFMERHFIPRGQSLGHQPYTSSVDSCLKLCNLVLPDLYMWNVEFDDEPTDFPYAAQIFGQGCTARSSGPTAPLALLSALLRALQNKDQGR